MMRSRLLRFFTTPWIDAFEGLDRCLDRGIRGIRGLLLTALGLLAGWWVYVPVHELLHAAACQAAGGGVTRLEIDRLYGGAALARVFPFVVPASEYAGRLSGFNTRGSDWIYLATDLGPFLLTLFPGVWALRRAATSRRPALFGAALPFALAPFLSLTGDAYEIGSILVTRLPPWTASAARNLLRGDDLCKKAEELAAVPGAPWGGALLATLAGLSWAFLVYGMGDAVARGLGAPTTTAAPSPSPEHPERSRDRRPSRRKSGP
ncbi:MAG TPA: hypothetical protein VHC97_01905 [Thermoanaerobaculia bacterium]|jgi:hypothetical protein|nr:hypothetical protein [Thermoanaerobaculia bacterium]